MNLPLKSALKGFHFGTKIVVFDLFTALVNFGDCCVVAIFVGKHIFTPL